MAYLKIIRPVNLSLIIITQSLLYFFFISPVISSLQADSQQSILVLVLISFTTVVLTAGGYVVNDLLDIEADKINKPNKNLIPGSISINCAWFYYFLLVGISGTSTFYLALKTNNITYFWIYIISTSLLYYYSKYFKHQVLTGNLIVALFCGFVPGILVYAFYSQLINLEHFDSSKALSVQIHLFFYIIFAFQTNFAREIIKDLQDYVGDKTVGSRTLATTYGPERTGVFSLFHLGILGILAITYVFYIFIVLDKKIAGLIGILGLILPILFLMKLLYTQPLLKAGRASYFIKIYMLSGLLYLILCNL